VVNPIRSGSGELSPDRGAWFNGRGIEAADMIEYRILGPLEVSGGGRAIDIPGAKLRALLVILLVRASELVPRDVLVHELWGERPPAGAQHSLEVYISRLRRALGAAGDGPVVLTRPAGYVIQLAAGQLDVTEFERLASEGRSAFATGLPDLAAQSCARRSACGAGRRWRTWPMCRASAWR
jgi:hypothetical protein